MTKTGRLFWKFFAILWLAQFVTVLGVSVLVWAHAPNGNIPPPPPPPLPPHLLHGEMNGLAGPSLHVPPPPPPPPRSPIPPLMPLAVGSAVSLLFAWWLAGYFARPIRTLHEAFDAEASGKLDTRIGSRMGQGQNELVALAQDFDRMAERLQQLVESQRRLLHDVSHELRSPLARLQAAADLLQQQPERAQELIERIRRDTGRIDSLIGELLTLARLDADNPQSLNEVVDLGEIVANAIEDAEFEAATKACTVASEIDEWMPVSGNSELLQRAIDNILRNAVQYTAVDSCIDVSARKLGDVVTIAVADYGPGVAAQDIEAIFEPFFRGALHSASGYGLGLAIACRVVRMHHGRITAENRPQGGLVIRIELPVAPVSRTA